MSKLKTKAEFRRRRHRRIRKKISGTADRPRLAVFKSIKHITVQLIDDAAEVTLASTSTYGTGKSPNLETAKELGKAIAVIAKDKGIEQAVFDRGGFAFKGKIAALAAAAREEGLKV